MPKKVTDARLLRCFDLVTFTVSGEGSLIGDEKIFANPWRAKAGIATALVRTSRIAGNVTVRAAVPGLTEATLHFQSVRDGREAVR